MEEDTTNKTICTILSEKFEYHSDKWFDEVMMYSQSQKIRQVSHYSRP